MSTSGTYAFAPSLSEFVIDAFERINIPSPALDITHLISARRSANLILTDWSGNRGVNLAHVDQVSFGLVPGLTTYTLPDNTVDLLDCYLRTYTASSTTANLGSALTAVVGFDGQPVIGTPYGDVVVSQPGGGVISCTAGSAVITFNWPSHGLSVGSPIFFGCPISIGGVSFSNFQIVSNVIDGNNVQFTLPSPVYQTQVKAGGTPLFYTQAGQNTVICILPSHGLTVGQSFSVPIATAVGGLTLSGTYTVESIQSLYQFAFSAGQSLASSTAVAFENSGWINVARQDSTVPYTDVPLFPLSRTDYAALPVKATPGRPTSYWVDRVVPPQVSTYPVADGTASWGFVAYRMRKIQDANPVNGEQLDAPPRAYEAFISALAAKLAEKWNRSVFAEKLQLAEKAWGEFASSDVERATLSIRPALQSYYR